MTAQRLDIVIEQGADFEQIFDLPAGLNLVGLQSAMEIRTAYGDPTSLLTLTTANGGLIVDSSTRKLKAEIDADTAAAFYAGNYVYDIKAKEASGKISRLYQGLAAVTAEVTLFDFEDEVPALLYHGGGYIVQHGGGRILLRV